MMQILGWAALGLALGSAPAFACTPATTGYGPARVPAINAFMERAMDKVRERFPPAAALTFKDVYLCRDLIEVQMTCGSVGTGDAAAPDFQRFLSNGGPAGTLLEREDAGFEQFWADTCVGA